MGLDIRLNQRLGLDLKLAPQIIQSIELLQLPSIELLGKIQEELDTNEFLETAVTQEAGTEQAPATTSDGDAPAATESAPSAEPEPGSEPEPTVDENAERDEAVEQLERADIWDDPELRRPRVRDEGMLNAKMEALQNSASIGPSLQDRLLEQYLLAEGNGKYEPLARQIIYNVDDNGYVSYPLEEIVEPLADRFDLEEAEFVLGRIQRLEPRGVAARTKEECLILQLDDDDPRLELKTKLIEKHLDDLFRNRLPKIAKSLGLDIEELKELLAELAPLTLRPGAGTVEDRNHYIDPDLILEWDGRDYEVRLANEYIPELRLSPSYRDVLSSKEVDSEYRDYVRNKVEKARAFIAAVQKRQKTLLDVARLIVGHQRDFFDFGPHYLKPLKMQQVADELGVHVSTISRATSDKYIQSHRGIFCLKDFFTGGTQSANGTMASREAVKQKVKEIVDREDKSSPLSDDDIVELLMKNHGLKVARRTVTKYRKALGIPSSRQRREY